ncbi:helix-turn-helix transcriptional regulator [Candidatus Parcubacteria bacterium]|nr:helix-turn-helix transcriptional regulator [Candidatus Parcubacteria bacterium]
MNKINKATDFQKYLKNQLSDKEFKKLYDEYGKQLKIAYQIIQLRKKQKITQLELAKKIGTTQSNIARMESGKQNFTVDILSKVAQALNKELKISIS